LILYNPKYKFIVYLFFKHCVQAVSEEAFQKMVERQVEILQKERTKTVCPPGPPEEFSKVHCEQQLEQNGAIPSIEEDTSCVVPSSTTDDSSNMEVEVKFRNIGILIVIIYCFK